MTVPLYLRIKYATKFDADFSWQIMQMPKETPVGDKHVIAQVGNKKR